MNRVSAAREEIINQMAIDADCSESYSVFDGAEERFESMTCLKLSPSATVHAMFNSYTLGEGDYLVVFNSSQEALEDYLDQPAPWGSSWQRGPLPDSMRRQGLDIFTQNGADILDTDSIWFASVDFSSRDIEFQNGNLLILSPDTNEIWFTYWDH